MVSLLHPEDEHIAEQVIRLHAGAIDIQNEDRCAFIVCLGDGNTLSQNPSFVRCEPEDVVTMFKDNMDSWSVRWLMTVLRTYDTSKEYIAAVKFPNNEVLCNTIRRRCVARSAADVAAAA